MQKNGIIRNLYILGKDSVFAPDTNIYDITFDGIYEEGFQSARLNIQDGLKRYLEDMLEFR